MVAELASSDVLADLVAESVRTREGAVGVLVQDVPAPDPGRLLGALAGIRDEGLGLRIAYLRPGGQSAADKVGFEEAEFSTEVEQAEQWRNERGLDALIVVIAHGDEAKLSSLEDFSAIGSRDLKEVLVRRALGEEAGQNEVQKRWWQLLEREDGIGLAPLIDYYVALSGKTGQDFVDASSREIHHLGLLPDPEFFNDRREAAVRSRLERNRELSTRMQTLNAQDRRRITQVLKAEVDAEQRAALQRALSQLDGIRTGGPGEPVSFQAAERLVQARVKKTNGGKPRRAPTERATSIAGESLVDEERAADVAAIVQGLQEQLNKLDERSLRTETLRLRLPEGTSEAVTTARLDLLNLLGKVLSEEAFGGYLKVEAPNLESALRRFDVEEHLVARWEGERIREFLAHFADDDFGARLSNCFNKYVEARRAVLPLLRALAVEPMVIATHPPSRRDLLDFIGAYEALNEALREGFQGLYDHFGQDANEVLGHLLLLETVVLQIGERKYAITAPTHPLYLWHYARYADIVETQRPRLDERDRGLVASTAEHLPFFLTSILIPSVATGTEAVLMYLGRIGPLPYFGEETAGGVSDDGVTSIRALIEAQLSLDPPSRRGYRLALIDPPDAGVYLSMLAELSAEGELSGAHLTTYRHPGTGPGGAELRLDAAEEERIARVFRAIAPSRLFSFQVRDLPSQDIGPPGEDLHHLVVAFDQGAGQKNTARPALHPIQPLALPRRIAYREMRKTVELEPTSGGPFQDYHSLVQRLGPAGTSYLAVHQQTTLREALHEIAMRTPWTAVADRQVDRDLAIGGLRIMTARDGDRDVAGFSRTAAPFRRPLRDVVREYNAYISNEDLDNLLAQLSDLLDAGVLSLRPESSGRTNFSRIKGLLGTLIAARWFRASGDDSTRLLISLDGSEARRWLHLSDESLRADLVGFTWTNDHCTVSVIEVKAVDARGTEYAVDGGVATGAAIDQMLSTRRLLQQVFARDRDNELITAPARREILREHLYRELTKATYRADERRLWADRVQRLLDGTVAVDLRCQLIDVRLGVDSSSLRNVNAIAHEDGAAVPVEIVELNERLIEVLVPSDRSERQTAELAPEESTGDDEQQLASPNETSDDPAEVAGQLDHGRAEHGIHPHEPKTPPLGAERPRALLGTAAGEYGKVRDIWFDPAAPEERLPNPHLMITGETGSGKTQATKALLAELRPFGVPALILDFKDDYSQPDYADAEDLRVYDPNNQPLPFNPLAPALDPRTGSANPTHHMHQLTNIIRRIYRLGDQQSYRLREAMKTVYEKAEIPARAFSPSSGQVYPPFSNLQEELQSDRGNQALLGRMSPIFDLELFGSEAQSIRLASILDQGTVVRLAQLPGDEVKNSVAEFFMMAYYNELISQPQSHEFSRLLVLDEAWRLVESPFLEPLMREGRAFGLGVIVASQFPTDLPAVVAGSTATKIYFSQTSVEQIRGMQRTILGKTSGADADHLSSIIRGLPPLTCVLYSKQFPRFARVSVNPYFERAGTM